MSQSTLEPVVSRAVRLDVLFGTHTHALVLKLIPTARQATTFLQAFAVQPFGGFNWADGMVNLLFAID